MKGVGIVRIRLTVKSGVLAFGSLVVFIGLCESQRKVRGLGLPVGFSRASIRVQGAVSSWTLLVARLRV